MKEIIGFMYQKQSVGILMQCNGIHGLGKKERSLILNPVYITWHTPCAA
jgi:hypothetical protein